MGAPKKEIKQEQFEVLCAIQCTQEEICAVLGVTDKTLNRWCRETYGKNFSEVFRKKRLNGKASLRRAQYQTAIKGNSSMLIWLGKQWLGQSENPNRADNLEDGISDDPITQSLNEEFGEGVF